MSRPVVKAMDQVRAALLSGDAQGALAGIDALVAAAARRGIDPALRDGLEARLEELRLLAQASLTGAQQAADQVRGILQAARSLQTYDSLGRRMVTATQADAPQRF